MNYLDRYYIAYGSNTGAEMKHRCPDSEFIGIGKLKNYRLVFKGYLDVEPCEGEEVQVAIYKITEQDKALLDAYEGAPLLYRTENCEVEMKDFNGDLHVYDSFVYVMNSTYTYAKQIYRNTYKYPNMDYFVRCIVGYMDMGMDVKQLYKALDRTTYLGIQQTIDDWSGKNAS